MLQAALQTLNPQKALKPITQSFQNMTELKAQVENKACQTGFYHWLLSSGSVPESLAIKLIDPWPGDIDVAKALCSGHFIKYGAPIHFHANIWRETEHLEDWVEALHQFDWLRDLRTLGGEAARKTARQLVHQWLDKYERWNARTWAPQLIGQRLANWLTFFDFFCASADEQFQKRYYESLIRQARHLSRFLGHVQGVERLRAGKALLFAGLSFEGREQWVLQGIDAILKEIPEQFLADGGHVSRSPSNLVLGLQTLLDVKCGLNRAGLPIPEAVQYAIDRAGQALRFFRYADKKLALFHDTQEGDIALMDALMTQSGTSSKVVRSLPQTGFDKVVQGRTTLMLDWSALPDNGDTKSYHAAPLSFEFAYGKDRLFTNCGTCTGIARWQEALRTTPAHNTLSVDNHDTLEIREDGFVTRSHSPIRLKREETRESCLLEAEHDGYLQLNGILHKRRLFLCDSGHDLRGEDTVVAQIPPTHPLEMALRFHLHPRVLVQIKAAENEALLVLPTGMTFKFIAVGGKLSVENSIYSGAGAKPLKTRQLVVSAELGNETRVIKWALQRG